MCTGAPAITTGDRSQQDIIKENGTDGQTTVKDTVPKVPVNDSHALRYTQYAIVCKDSVNIKE